jgi:hypothetical protein
VGIPEGIFNSTNQLPRIRTSGSVGEWKCSSFLEARSRLAGAIKFQEMAKGGINKWQTETLVNIISMTSRLDLNV